ncbi:MAG TPA: class I SAM-dependent methyltransferase [Candidatus Omnitrophota bacterium]|nr:class I SAM-dependent methyltransferase [Candidatus Omnitrophota bacterium]
MQIFEGSAEFYSVIYASKPYKKEAEFVLNWIPKKPKEILDLGCGTGSHSIIWAKKGIKVIGVDLSANMIQKVPRHKNISLICGNIPNVLTELSQRKFYLVTSLFNVMGYVNLNHVLQQLPLKKGGYFVFDVWDKQRVEKFPPKIKTDTFPNFTRTAIPFVESINSIETLPLRIKYVFSGRDGTPIFDEEHEVCAYDMTTIFKWAHKAGFEVVSKRPYQREGDWTIWYLLQKMK